MPYINLTLAEARELYNNGGKAREIALQCYSEGEIINDYTKFTKLDDNAEISSNAILYAKLQDAYTKISKGREIQLTTEEHNYCPLIYLTSCDKRCRYGDYVGKMRISGNDRLFRIYIDCQYSKWNGRFGFGGGEDYRGDYLIENQWIFKEIGQVKQFVKCFYKELILVSLGDMYKVEFIDDEE